MTQSLGLVAIDVVRFGGGRGGAALVLLLVGIGFAGLLVWAIERSGNRAA